MPELPAGTVTFLFTDVEGSTRLLNELGDTYADVLADHRRLLRAAFCRHGGVEVDAQGDAFFVAFARASDAIAAARDATDAPTGPIRVRIGIHTGEPLVTDEGYVGIDVHRAARIAAAGHGGQVLVSQSTRDLVGADDLRDLGEHRLKDLTAPERIYQLGDDDFPPLKSLNATNLPVASGVLIGRVRELDEVVSLLDDSVRLVTLTGTGGTGKTRLGLQAAAELTDSFAGGVFFVPLSGVEQAELVPATIASTVGVRALDDLRERNALLLIDNFEHLLDAAASVADLLRTARNVKVLATSRAPLRVEGEREYPLDPLASAEAVELLTERARAVRPSFVPDDATTEICRKLDGLPLALELAASRLRSLEPAALLERLDRMLPVLTTGRRDAPERQRTLRGTIEWSYDLLDAELQAAFARLGVFATFTLEAAEDVADADFGAVDALVEASLVKPMAGGRFLMLGTIREFALERLAASGEEEAIRARHLRYLTELARAAKLHSENVGPMRHELVVPEQNNIRAALDWAISTGRQEEGLALAVALENYWLTTDANEGTRWLSALLELGTPSDPLLMMALRCLGNNLGVQGDPGGVAFHERSLAIARELGSSGEIASLLHRIAVSRAREGRTEDALALNAEAEVFNREAKLDRVEAEILWLPGLIERRAGNLEAALLHFETSLAAAGRAGYTWWQRNVLLAMAAIHYELGRSREGLSCAVEGLRIARDMGDRPGLADTLAVTAHGYALHDDRATAGRILGSIDAEIDRAPIPGWDPEDRVYVQPLRAFEGPEFARGREEGRALPLDDIVDDVLRSVD